MKKEDKKITRKTAPAVKQEIKKKAVPVEKKPAAKPKKEAKKAVPAARHELKVKKAPKIVAEAPKRPEKIAIAEEHKAEVKAPTIKKPPKLIKYHGKGGRKTSGARVWLSAGTGRYIINGRTMEEYAVKRKILCKMAMEPFVITNTLGKYDVRADVHGGGYASQIGAVRQAVSQALTFANPELRPVLRKAGLLTRDPRVKERKKYGQKRARKRFQYSKR